MKVRRILLLTALWACLAVQAGDGPFAGGAGDGFAQAGLEWEALAVGQTTAREAAVYPSPVRSGLEIFTHDAPGMAAAVLYSASGAAYAGMERTGAQSWRLPLVPPGLYLIQWEGEQGQRYFSRVVITTF